MTTPKQQFSEYLGNDEQGNMRLRLGTKFAAIYVEKGKDIFKETANGLVKLPLEELVSKPWIRQNFDRERAFQRRKALAIGLQSSHIPLHERRAYKKRMGWVGAH